MPVSVFPCIWVSQKRNTKRSPIDVPIFDDFLWTKRSPRSKRVGPEESRVVHEGGGAPYPLGAPPYLVDDSGIPLRRVPEQGPDWFLVATKACGGGTPDLGYFLEVSVFIGIFGVRNKSGGSPGCPRDRGRALGGWVRPPPSWAARDSSGPTPMLRGLLLVHKKSSKIGTSIGLHLVFLFCKTQKQGENRNWHWALG